MTEDQPTEETIRSHVRNLHGYERMYAALTPPELLLDEHHNIHDKFDPARINHTHDGKFDV